jgi:hypothetical protein
MDLDMFGMLVLHWIAGNMDGTLIVYQNVVG